MMRGVQATILRNKRAVMGLSGLTKQTSARSFSTILDGKEHAEESRYIRQKEEERKAELRANFEKLLAEQHSEKSKEVLNLLAPPKEEESFIKKHGIDRWNVAVPLSITFLIPLLVREVIVIDLRFQLATMLFLTAGVLHNKLGPTVYAVAEAKRTEIIESVKKFEDNLVSKLNSDLEGTKELFTLEEDFKSVDQVVDDASVVQADVLNYTAEHKYRDAVQKKLENLQALEENFTNAVRTKMITNVTNDVITAFTNDKKAKDAALDHAIAVLTAGSSAKLGVDVVGNAFKTSLETYRKEFETRSPELQTLLKALEKDVAEVSTAPVVDESNAGGNVYVTHPIKTKV